MASVDLSGPAPLTFARPTPEPTDSDLMAWAAESEAVLAEALRSANVGRDWRAGKGGDRVKRAALLSVATLSRIDLRDITERLRSSTYSVARWSGDFIRSLGSRLQAGWWALAGEVGTRDADARPLLGQIAKQFQYFSKFRAKVVSGASLIGPQASANAALFGSSTWGAAHNVMTASMALSGRTEAMRVLGGALRHCDECPGLAGIWVPIGSIRPIGSCTCRSNCVCTIKYR